MKPNNERNGITSDELCQQVSADNGGACLLAFSRGKDSIGTWIQCRRYFTRIIPFTCYLVPGMEFEEKSLKYFEEVFGSRIISVPHPSVSRFAANQVFGGPEDNGAADWMTPLVYRDIYQHIIEKTGLPALTLCAVGVRSADSIHRRRAIMHSGGIMEAKGEFYPIHDWRADRLEKEIRDAGIELPVDYRWWGRSFDGLDARFTTGLHKHAPDDYRKLLALYPLARADELRMKWRAKYAGH